MAVEVKCAIYNGDPRVINKSTTLVKSVMCKMTDPTDIMDPVIILNKDNSIVSCNYFVIGHRKYFKVREIRTSNNIIKIVLHQDVLSTWLPRVVIKGMIYNASETVSNDLVQDFVLESYRRISRVKISNEYEEVTSDPAIIVQSPLPTIMEG